MNHIKDSIPLMVEMTNIALRDRHWQLLMTKTGHSFEMTDIKMYDIFEMGLYKHKTSVLEIVNTAMNEVVIESFVEHLIDKWNSITFTLVPHSKSQNDRG